MAEQRTRFVGTYEFRLDDKGRMVLPAKMRAQLGETGMMSKNGPCLGLWTLDGFDTASDQFEAKVETGEVSLDAFRQFNADAHEVTPDQQGRIVIPQRLRTYARLGPEVVVTGVRKRIEIWDKQIWDAQSDARDEQLSDGLQVVRF